MRYYTGDIKPDENTVFVFGSNPEGRHCSGSAKCARTYFGAVYGKGEGRQGWAYALPTKDLRVLENDSLRSISPEQIEKNIAKMYGCARNEYDKTFAVAYRNKLDEATLCGYTGEELINMFINAAKRVGGIPSNVIFSEEWISTGKFDNAYEPTLF